MDVLIVFRLCAKLLSTWTWTHRWPQTALPYKLAARQVLCPRVGLGPELFVVAVRVFLSRFCCSLYFFLACLGAFGVLCSIERAHYLACHACRGIYEVTITTAMQRSPSCILLFTSRAAPTAMFVTSTFTLTFAFSDLIGVS